jgi:hypothetical protein
MIHENIGTTGHLMVIGSFVTAALATFSYFKATQSTDELAGNDWKKTARAKHDAGGVVNKASR